MELFQILAVLLGVSGALIAPTIWFYRHSIKRSDEENKAIISKLESTNTAAFTEIKKDLKDFRNHFDYQLNTVHQSVDTRNREMKEFVAKELEYFRNYITNIERKIEQTRERSHEIEKDLLRLENTIQRDYITKSDLEGIVKNIN